MFGSSGELLGTVALVKPLVRDLLELRQMRTEERLSKAREIRVGRVIDLDQSPGVPALSDSRSAFWSKAAKSKRDEERGKNEPTNTNGLPVDLDLLPVRTDDGEREEGSKLGVLGAGLLVVFFNVVRERVDRDLVVLFSSEGRRRRKEGSQRTRNRKGEGSRDGPMSSMIRFLNVLSSVGVSESARPIT